MLKSRYDRERKVRPLHEVSAVSNPRLWSQAPDVEEGIRKMSMLRENTTGQKGGKEKLLRMLLARGVSDRERRVSRDDEQTMFNRDFGGQPASAENSESSTTRVADDGPKSYNIDILQWSNENDRAMRKIVNGA